ncbi:unnamed protein product [Brassica rapa]|uniref:Uncharacterized protein n=2 Tax=Brassica TaxID=3705 RepID=A0A8D9G846_BRACM|nr:unnamed protein product [Brassica napus]CAG7872805.1 unnamed protein product [Brassica rapa]CDY48080.1 BnaA06g33480D [Brassica napus]
MFHESFECDGELDSNDEQHDEDELTIGGELRRWGLMIGASERGETTNHGLQSRDAERLHGIEESRTRCFATERRKRKKTKDDTAPPANLIVPRTR